MVMEKSWNIRNWQKVMEFWEKLWNYTNCVPEFCQMCALFANMKKFSIGLKIPHFTQISRMQTMVMKNCETVLENSWRHFFSKSVGTLSKLVQSFFIYAVLMRIS